MTHQLVNILEFIIPETVEAEIHRHQWDSRFDDLTKQQIVLGVLNRVPPCYQLLPPECLTPELSPPLPLSSASTSVIEPINSAAHLSRTDATAPSSKAVCSLTVEAMLPAHTLKQLQAAVSMEMAKYLTSNLTH